MDVELQNENTRLRREFRALNSYFAALRNGTVQLVPSKDIEDGMPSNIHTLPTYLTCMMICVCEALGDPIPKEIEWKAITSLDPKKEPEECDTLMTIFKSLERRSPQNEAS